MPKATPSKGQQAQSQTRKDSPPKTQAKTQDSSKLDFTAEATPLPVDEEHKALEDQRAELHKPGRVSKADAEFIDNDPGYNKDQIAHMREYWGIKPDDSTVEAEEGQLVEEMK